jgi:hypothetical protein
MVRVCRRKSDGRIVESQSGDGGTNGLAVLVQNATNAGLVLADYDFLLLDDAVFAADLAAQIAAESALTQAQHEEEARRAVDTCDSTRVNAQRLFKAKCISDLAFRLNKAPGALTAGELSAERDRIAAIYKAL